jgi:hypothetical protein
VRRIDPFFVWRGLVRIYVAEGRFWLSIAMTEAKLLAASAGTWPVRSDLGILGGYQSHHVGGWAALLKQLNHLPHCWHRVGEE